MNMNTQTDVHFPRTPAVVVAGAIEIVPTQAKPLSRQEAKELDGCELRIQGHFDGIGVGFRAIGRELEMIRDGRLYRVRFRTFSEYVKGRWGKTYRWALQRIDASKVLNNLMLLEQTAPEVNHGSLSAGRGSDAPPGDRSATRVDVVSPVSERQARELVRLEPEQQLEAWRDAVKSAPGGQATARHVKQAVERRLGSPASNGQSRIEKILDACQRSIVAVRALQDLLDTTDTPCLKHCEKAVREIECMESKFVMKRNRALVPESLTTAAKASLRAAALARWAGVKAKSAA